MKEHENWPLPSVSFNEHGTKNDQKNLQIILNVEKIKEQYKQDAENRLPQHFSANKRMKVQATY